MLNIFECKKIIEIGTYIGFSTAAMALNSGKDATIYTIDLPDESIPLDADEYDRKLLFADWKKNDDFLRHHQKSVGSFYIEELEPDARGKVHMIKCDSTKLSQDIIEKIKGADLFFIDGGHAFDIIASDTKIASSSIQENGWIIWHDYKSKTHTEVTQFIDSDFSNEHLVLHIENTMLAMHAPNLKHILKGFA
jgi:hypothetical protein